MQLKILFDDPFIIAVDKPSGISTIPNDSTDRENSLVGMVEKHCGKKIFVVHRLDKETSGIVVFAKDPDTHRFLNIEFDNRRVKKKYIGIVVGRVEFENKEISIPISKSKIHSKRVSLSSKGIEAVTIVKTLKKFKDYSVLEINPVTGRRHQIRLHLKAIGHTLAVDPLYGRKEPIVEGNNIVLNRLPLHAKEISFIHPNSKERITIESSLPEDMRRFVDMLR